MICLITNRLILGALYVEFIRSVKTLIHSPADPPTGQTTAEDSS
jgi:hypothetical protein